MLYHLGKVEEKRKCKACYSLGKHSKTKKIIIITRLYVVKDYFKEIRTQDREEKTICL